MGYKIVCFECRKAFSTGFGNNHMPEKCSECGSGYAFFNHKFRPPRKEDVKSWKIVSFFYENGFNFQHIYKDLSLYRAYVAENQVAYPKTIDEAKEFVIKYRNQAKKFSSSVDVQTAAV